MAARLVTVRSPGGTSVTTPARRRTRAAGIAVAALTGGLALQPMLAAPAQAGINCDSDPLPIIGGLLNDCTPPESKIIGKPRFETTSTEATFLVTTEAEDPDGKDVTFECRLDRGFTLEDSEPVQDWTDCSVTDEADDTPLGRITYTGLTPDDYIFSVRASDVPNPLLVPLGDTPNTEQTPETYEWSILPAGSIEDVLPETRITSKPRRWHPYSFAAVGYAADGEVQRFECTLNGKPYDDCGLEQANIMRIGAGDATFGVRAVNFAGQRDEVPATTRWTVPRDVVHIKSIRKGWKTVRERGHFRDTYAISQKRGASFAVPVNGARSAAVVVTRCPTCGKLKVTTNKGKLVKAVKLRSKKTRTRRVVEIGSWKKPRSGRYRFVVASRGKDVIVEGVATSEWR